MTMSETLKRKLSKRRPVIGSWISLASEETCEIMIRAGFDWLGIDMEHTAIGVGEMARLIRIIDLAGIAPVVRVGANDPLLIKRALDAGAQGIIAPMVNSAADAEAAVAAAHYPPKGTRGVGLHRAQGYGPDFAAYKKWMDDEGPLVVAQIEHKDGVDNLDAIMAVPGLDAFFIGPYDLSASYGTPGDFTSADVAAAMRKVDAAVNDGPIAGGIHVVEPDAMALAARLAGGHCFIAYGVDMIFLTGAVHAARTVITNVKANPS
ncbi:MAG: aldolase/citrate lyase family protein [Alphaproteobacteria bacterium]